MGIFATVFGAKNQLNAIKDEKKLINGAYVKQSELLRNASNPALIRAAGMRADSLLNPNGAIDAFQRGQGRAEALFDPFTRNNGRNLKFLDDALGAGDSGAAINRFKGSASYLLNFDAANKAGQTGVEARFGSNGMSRSGNALRALQDRAQETSNQFFGQYVGGLKDLVDNGQQAAGSQAQIRQNTASGVSSMMLDAGKARAVNSTNTANNITDLRNQSATRLANLVGERATKLAKLRKRKGDVKAARWGGVDGIVSGGLKALGGLA